MTMDNKISYRTMPVAFRSDEGPGAMDFVAATENPVQIFDWDRGVIDEVLLMRGLALPGKRQVPFLDGHSATGTHDVLGSARNLQKDGSELIAQVTFATNERGKDAESLYRDGHMTDVSIGYRVSDAQWVPEGEQATIGERTFQGPVKVVTSWSVRELSAVPIGADEAAKKREAIRSITNPDPQMVRQWEVTRIIDTAVLLTVEAVTGVVPTLIERSIRK